MENEQPTEEIKPEVIVQEDPLPDVNPDGSVDNISPDLGPQPPGSSGPQST